MTAVTASEGEEAIEEPPAQRTRIEDSMEGRSLVGNSEEIPMEFRSEANYLSPRLGMPFIPVWNSDGVRD
jgi:hypothetical protein